MKTLSLLTLTTLFFCISLPLSSVAMAKEDAGTTAGPIAEKDACCKPAPVVTPKPPACCAATPIQNPQSQIENFTRSSLYQSDGTFTDDSGKSFALSSLRGRPVVLNMFFASCGYACPLTVTDLLSIQGRLSAEQRSKTIFVLVSFDVTRDTTAALAQYRAQRGLDAQWILLRGDNDSVRELAALLGVKYKQEADGSFAHSNLVTILNSEGEIVHQRTGLQGGLAEATAALASCLK